MKIIVTGSHNIEDYNTVLDGLDKSNIIKKATMICSPCGKGANKFGIKFAHENNIPIIHFPAKWRELGKIAGAIRNTEMAEYADGLIAFHKNGSHHTQHMINIARAKGLAVEVFKVIDLEKVGKEIMDKLKNRVDPMMKGELYKKAATMKEKEK